MADDIYEVEEYDSSQDDGLFGSIVSASDRQAISDLSCTANQVADVANKVADVLELREKRKAFEAATKLEAERIRSDYQENKLLIEKTYAKQSRALDLSEKVLDDALEKGNDAQVLAALSTIAGVAKQSIADELSKNKASKNNTSAAKLEQMDDTEALPWADF